MKRIYTEDDCLWQQLARERRPIFLYGTGNGADKILDVCIKFNIPIAGIFASDGFVRSRSFRGMPVQSLGDIEAANGEDFIVLLAFGTTLPSVWEKIEEVGRRHTLRIPEVPQFGGELFDFAYYEAHLPQLRETYHLLSDDFSRELFEDMIAFRLTGEPVYLAKTENMSDSLASLLGQRKFRTILDCGAYTGDSAKIFADALHPTQILAVEPDPKTYQKLCRFADEEVRCRIRPIHAAVGAQNGEMEFVSCGSRASGAGENAGGRAKRRIRSQTIPCCTIDTLLSGENRVDLIKLDVEGEEAQSIRGAGETIRTCRPALAVSLYHRTEDLFVLPGMLRDLYPDAKFYLRRPPCVPAWDLTLYVVPE